MTKTPRKLVHWDADDISLSDTNFPIFDDSIDPAVPTASLEYVNSQLVAYGFTPAPGLVLEGIANSALERIIKCLLGMLSQRVEDMSRTEELATKLRTLSYDHERLISMHQNATETAANAEREMNVHKSRLTAATRALKTAETAHKHTTAELTRSRSIVQGIRATHQNEIRKREKDMDRMSEKWQKVADAQAKLMAIPSGMRCANASVVTGSEFIGKNQGFLEIALEEAEMTRSQLGEENINLRKLILTAVNEVQSILHQAQCLTSCDEEPIPFTLTTLFPLHPTGAASDKVNHILTRLRECLATLSQSSAISLPTPKTAPTISDREVERLQAIVSTLKDELERSRKQTLAQATETQAMFDKLAENDWTSTGNSEMSMELLSVPLRDTEKERLDNIKRELDQERQKYTEAAIKLGQERAEIEAERIKLLNEKRSWQVEMMLAELPPTPQLPASPKRTATIFSSPRKSPRKSPAKIYVGKAGTGTGRKTTRVSRRSSTSASKPTFSYETEILPPLPAPTFDVTPLLTPASLLPTSFVLPPPSPYASLPTQPALLPAIPPPNLKSTHESTAHTTSSLCSAPSLLPSTPPAIQHPFPVAKPFAQRMIHAYSPAKPSPLSRILMLGNSPNSPESIGLESGNNSNLLQPVIEEEEEFPGFEEPLVPLNAVPAPQQMSLAAELGVSESPPESPLQEKKIEPNVVTGLVNVGAGITTTKGRVFHPDPKRFTIKEKGKMKAQPALAVTNTRFKTSAAVEKENSNMKSAGKVFSAPTKVSPPGGEAKKPVKSMTKLTAGVSTSRARLEAKLPPPSKGGPRRVLVDSAEAPPIGKGWRG